MTGKVIELKNVLTPDQLATRITERYVEWETLRQVKKVDWEEVRRYVYATDTTQTTNARLPWKNRTTIPKLCQIRDNLYSNYTATMFPKRKWLTWEANDQDSNQSAKRDAITNYMSWCIEQPMFKHELDKIIMDYIDYGNCFATVEWTDLRTQDEFGKTTAGYVGPSIRRLSPLDIVMNPTAENFIQSPKIIRSIISLGELRAYFDRLSNDENRQTYEELFEYLQKIRFHARQFQGYNWEQQDHIYQMDGFTSFRAYLLQDYVEILTFYGDWYDDINNIFEKNRVITVVDRHKLISNRPNPSFFGYAPIFHVPWRKKQDNLWGMGPLDNLIGMQYRLDHIENMRADVVDVGTFPVQKVKGFVEDYVWQPMEKIFVGEEGDVELLFPEPQLAGVDFDLQRYVSTMEEMAGAPKEAMGFRSPGEKTAYEVQRMENAASRIYQNKINQFEEQMLEPLLNAMLELARRNMASATTIRVFDDDFKLSTFQTLTVEDITGVGRIKPIAARHFAEKAELIQNLTNLANSPVFQMIAPHISAIHMAKIVEEVFDLREYDLIAPWVGLAEQAEAQMKQMALQEQMQKRIGTATGQNGDFDTDGSVNPYMQQRQQASQGSFLKRPPTANATPGGMVATQ